MLLTIFNIFYVLVALAMCVLILLQRGDGAKNCRLACSRKTHQRDDLAGLDLEIDAAEHALCAANHFESGDRQRIRQVMLHFRSRRLA